MNYARQRFVGLVAAGATLASVAVIANEPLSLDGAVREALRSNPALAEARARVKAVSNRLEAVAAFPNPMLRYSGMDSVSRLPSSDTAEHRFMVEQMLPWFGKRALRRDVAGAEADATFYRWKAAAQEVVAQVKKTFFALQAAQQSRVLLREEQQIVRQATAIARTRYAYGKGSLQRLSRNEAELAMLERRELDLATRESELTHQLNRLLGRAAETPLILKPAEIPTALVDAVENGVAAERANPELRVKEADLRRRSAERDLMEKNFLPDVTVGLDYRAMPMGEDMAMISVGVELPLWRRPLHARVREAASMVQAGTAAVESIQLQVEAEVESASAALRNAWQSLELLRRHQLPQIEAEVAAAEAAYRGGRGDFLEVLDAARRQRETRIMEVMAVAEVGKQAARLEQVLGMVAVPFDDNEER